MNRDLALLDASLARAREGLRVLGEIARFILLNKEVWLALKAIRHGLIAWERAVGGARLIAARVGKDPGEGEAEVGSEYQRRTIYELGRANFNRVTETMRVLEEFSKLYAPKYALVLEANRYKLYALERMLLSATPHFWFQQYAAEGFIYSISSDVPELMYLINRGARVVQLRDKDSLKIDFFEKAAVLCRFVAEYNKTASAKVLVILNDHVDIAARLPVAGVHLGQSDYAVNSARKTLGSNKLIGRSNGTLEEIKSSVEMGADYVSLGPVFATPNKKDRALVGLEALKKAALATELPLIAIGGINSKNIHQVYQADVQNCAVIRAAREFFK
ncbi:MAG: thiamine phosphate synthase [Candidatus Magasanikbacteria bacterium]|nr:thiamine phosphate synthase [Candidatus Magasanikbacteria bacterium]